MSPTIKDKALHFMKHRLVRPLAESSGFSVYEPLLDYRKLLEQQTEFIIDKRPIRDKRPTTIGMDNLDLTLTTDGLEDVIDISRFRNKRVMETGPKYGIHSRWIDLNLQPSELVFCDFASDKWRHERWDEEIRCRHQFVYGDLRHARELLTMEPFDLVFFLGVMYHSAYHLQLLSMLNRITKLGGIMLLETTCDSRSDAVLRLNWQSKTGKAKMVPSLEALRVMLAWTGWRKATHFTDYRPDTTEQLLMCEKTDELVNSEADFCAAVTLYRLGPDGMPMPIE